MELDHSFTVKCKHHKLNRKSESQEQQKNQFICIFQAQICYWMKLCLLKWKSDDSSPWKWDLMTTASKHSHDNSYLCFKPSSNSSISASHRNGLCSSLKSQNCQKSSLWLCRKTERQSLELCKLQPSLILKIITVHAAQNEQFKEMIEALHTDILLQTNLNSWAH